MNKKFVQTDVFRSRSSFLKQGGCHCKNATDDRESRDTLSLTPFISGGSKKCSLMFLLQQRNCISSNWPKYQ